MSMGTSAQEAYLESRIFSAGAIELVQILYQAALEAVEKARRHLRQGEIAARSRAISQAGAILAELSLSLKHDSDCGLTRNLVELYDYMQRRLIQANLQQSEAPLAEVASLLATLLEAWLKCKDSAGVPSRVCFDTPAECWTV